MKKLFILIIAALCGTNAAFADYAGTTGDCNWYLNTTTKTLTISGSGAMGNYAYITDSSPWYVYRLNITSVSIGNSVTSIGQNTFSGCTGLTSVTIPNSVTIIRAYAFLGCTGLTSVTIPNNVTSIGSFAFSGCTGLTSVTIPNSVTSIESSAFKGTGLTSVTIPNSVTRINISVFSGCTGLTAIDVDEANTQYSSSVDGVLYNKNKTTLSAYPAGKQGAFTIPNSVTSIEYQAFYGCTGLTSVTIPNSVTIIGDGAFRGCSGLTSVTIPISVTRIASTAFEGCSGLTAITIPTSVTSIERDAFAGCSNLQNVKVGWTTPLGLESYIVGTVFSATLVVPIGTVSSYKSAFGWKSFQEIVASGSLSSLSVDGYGLSPAFDTDITNYLLTVPYETDNAHIAANVALPNDVVAVSDTGIFSLNYGVNTFPIHVAAEDGEQGTYAITILRGVYAVTFTGDSINGIDRQIINPDATATEPAKPNRDGYTFEGWYNGETEYDFDTPVTTNLTLTAKWKLTPIIIFNALPVKTYGDAKFSLTATSSSPVSLVFTSSNEAVATISGNIVTITGAGQTEITVNQASNINYAAAAPVTRTLTVNQTNQTITWSNIPSKTYGDADFDLRSTTNRGLTIAYTSDNESVATVTGNHVHITGAGTAQITATQAGNTNYAAATPVTNTLTVNQANQTIASGNISKTFGDADFDLPDTTNRGLTIVYASDNTSVATVTDNHVHIVGAGTAQITATQAGDANYNAATSVTRYLTVNSNSSAITFAELPTKMYGDAPFELVATSTVSDPITFISSANDIVSISGTTATIHKAGSVSITASQTGGAATFTRALDIDKATVTITANDTSMFYGDDKPTSFTYRYSGFLNGETEDVLTSLPTFGCSVYSGSNVGNYDIEHLWYHAAEAGNYQFSYQNGTLTVKKANAGVIDFWENDTTFTYGEVSYLYLLPNTTDKGRYITYTSDNEDVASSGSWVSIHKAGTAHITATVEVDTANYNAVVPVTRTVTVNKIDAGVIDFWENDTTVTYGEVSYLYLPNTTDKGRSITYTSDNEDVASCNWGRIYINKAGATRITATVAENENYTAVDTVIRTLTVNKIDAGVIDFWENDTTFTYGEVSYLNLPYYTDKWQSITYTSDNDDVVSSSGSYVSINKAGTARITATVAADTAYYTAVAPVTRTVTVNKIDAGTIDFWENDTTITYGEVGGLQLPHYHYIEGQGQFITYTSDNEDVASTSGSYVSINKAGTTLITATVTNVDTVNYTAVAPVTRTLTVNKGNAGTIDFWKNDTTVTYGEVSYFNLPYATDRGWSITYTSDNQDVASTAGNTVYIHKAGTAHITATVEGVTGRYTVVPVTRTLTVNARTGPVDPGPTPTAYTVTFNTNGGSSVASKTVNSGATVSKPADPTRTGYTFAGWNYGNATFNFYTPITTHITLTAQWTRNSVTPPTPYTVTFNSRVGYTVALTVYSGASVSISKPADPTRAGYTFGGWFYDIDCQVEWFSSDPITSNTTLYAKWTATSTAIETVTDKLQLYPNPTTDVVHIKNANGAEVKVYNHIGILLHRTNESRIDLSAYPNGIYLLKVGEQTLKVVKK
ncbi:glycoside hydrolase family 5 [Candidatus Symbiothrix dinenymphae]|nr:glycoside hydrolase family 5 [Candidatus Symbiothrix dinenymphae]